jgi:hypothetical protein
MKYIHLLSFALFGLIWSCSPKAAETVVDNVPESQKPEEVMPDPNTPCTTLKQLKGYIREEVETAFVIYRDQIKINKDYEKAFPLWEKAYYGAPGANGKVKYHFDDGIAIYKHFYENTDDETLRATYVDSVKAIYNKRAECFGGDDYIAGRLAFDYYYTFNNYVSEDETFDLFKQNIDAKGDSADYFVINPFTKMLYDRILNEQISIKEGQKYANQIFKTIEYGQANCKGTLCEAWEIISEYAPVRLEALEGIDGFYDCTYYGDKYYPQFKADSENCETIELVYRRLLRGGCADDDPRLIEVKIAKDTKCYVPPPPPGPLKQAFNAYNEGDYRNAVVKFDDFVQKTDDVEKKAKYLLLIAKIYYRDLKDFPQARKYAMRAAGLKDNWGEPFMLIGKLYASSGPLCGPGRGWDSQIVTWPAIDKWQYAKKIDPSVAEEADKLVRQYWQYMPKKADIFSRLINAGSSFRVQCWIQENTTVRTAD